MGEAYMDHLRWAWIVFMAFWAFRMIVVGIFGCFLIYKEGSLSAQFIALIVVEIVLAIIFILHFIYLKKRWHELGKNNTKLFEENQAVSLETAEIKSK